MSEQGVSPEVAKSGLGIKTKATELWGKLRPGSSKPQETAPKSTASPEPEQLNRSVSPVLDDYHTSYGELPHDEIMNAKTLTAEKAASLAIDILTGENKRKRDTNVSLAAGFLGALPLEAFAWLENSNVGDENADKLLLAMAVTSTLIGGYNAIRAGIRTQEQVNRLVSAGEIKIKK